MSSFLSRLFSFEDSTMATTARSHQDKVTRTSNKSVGASAAASPVQTAREREDERNQLAREVANIPNLVQKLLNLERDLSSNHYMVLNEEFKSQLHQAQRDAKRANSDILLLQSDLELRENEVQKLRAKEQNLRNFVVESHQYREVSHDEIITAFAILRQDAQKLASSRMFQLADKTLDFGNSPSTVGVDFSGLWSRSKRHVRLLILRSIIFKILEREVFSYRGFGITSLDAVTDFDTVLSDFEDTLTRRGVPTDVICNWKLSTMRAVELTNSGDTLYGKALAEQMYNYFVTLVKDEATDEERTKLRHGFGRLCHDAYSLRLLIRKCKTEYRCVSVPSGALLRDTAPYAEVFDFLESSPVQAENVAFTLFGALVTMPLSPEEREVVLEKAQVVSGRW
ncbi:hypothetical protein BGZ63DRAFT_387783 [Mariannaea sp. PMI_226]|nr:hypothetical protein BGZ63DRAFT_387783 [Mariannaea sp. PMI_226]